MSMQGGSVSVNNDESDTSSGLAGVIYQHIKTTRASELSAITAMMTGAPEFAGYKEKVKEAIVEDERKSRLSLLRSWAKQANDLGPPIVAYIQAEARVSLIDVKATVNTSTSTGRTPNPNDPNTAIQGPASAVELPVTGDGGATTLPVQLVQAGGWAAVAVAVRIVRVDVLASLVGGVNPIRANEPEGLGFVDKGRAG